MYQSFLQNKKLAIFFISLFLILSITSYNFFAYDKTQKTDTFLKERTTQNILNYNVVYTKYKEISSIIYETRIDTPDVKWLLKQIYEGDEKTKDLIRTRLHQRLKPTYDLLKTHNIKQLHFHLPNNDSFLRFHRPQKFGDNLTNIRSTVKYVNENKKPIDGFEEGRIYNGYRFVFPLSIDDLYLGSVEVSYSTLAMNL